MRRAADGDTFTTLDGQVRSLLASDLVDGQLDFNLTEDTFVYELATRRIALASSAPICDRSTR